MMLWIAIGLLTALAVAAIAWPLRQARGQAAADRRDYGLEVYKAQLQEIERDLSSGVLSADQASAARLEVQRRLLAESHRPPAASGIARGLPLYRAFGLAVIGGILPLGAVMLYLALGSPGAPDMPLVSRQAEFAAVAQGTESLETEIASLRQRLTEQPGDLEGWLALGETLRALERYADSAEAYRRAAHISSDPDTLSAYAEALIFAQNGTVPVEASTILTQVLEQAPGEPRARYYLGIAEEQAGRPREALEYWVSLEADSPPDAPWRAMLTARIEKTAAEAGIPLAGMRAEAAEAAAARRARMTASGPSQAEIEAAQQMSAEERAAFVQSMVGRLAERLKEQPEDVEGWLRLGRAYEVLNRRDDAIAAYGEAARVAPDRVDVLLAQAHAQFPPGSFTGDLPAPFLAIMQRVQELSPEHPEALFFLGQAAAQSGDSATARRFWTRLLAAVPADSPLHAELTQRLNALPN
ncbi:MAG: c-type cytochrome biogenesis protein CcmI [Alphaproteobacteria bacterium]|nr:c-type cytochrome biogenesis protein CcmI [Alphaproteobacteria bacterium]MBU0796316.1 c-type cytochrome biogenesis protein CcmI [Alphaproteobacteria bacterium]MBU0889167.1 c-type cytochrome biogenesis protein CcmI [Alphaproteobacteria bacterium]MBU1812201.1 c-type cytochrome biogenesis protein CcmI [Alphaproteobacteria bacterium]